MTSTATADSDPIVQFYRLEGTDSSGRKLDEIWTWDHSRLELVHDYIQWLFPLPQRSAFNPSAPVLTESTTKAFLDDERLQQHLKRSLGLMLEFYGLLLVESSDGAPSVTAGPEFPARSGQWLQPGNHNHLRLSRILASVRLLGLSVHSRALFDFLSCIYASRRGSISAITVDYWRHAASGQ